MQNTKTKIKSFLLLGLFMVLFLGFSLSSPESAVASVETVSTQINYQSEIVYIEMAATDQVAISPDITADAFQDDKGDFITTDQSEDDDGNWYLEWLKKLFKKGIRFAKSLAWSG